SHQHAPFELTMSHFDTFIKRSKHILYLGLSYSHQLHQLKNTLEEVCFKAGYKKDTRLYKPHITLSKKTVFKHTFNQNIKEFTYTVTGVSLMLSHRVNGILTYDRLYYKGFDTDDINETHRTTL
ncbi:MAG: 2'-5' RNA ligase family protein, partial [Candidatus Izimaplasma sp.]|nr:2'-5' RNA ligase family protein [Candidatus Izimaplasma bacterium]